MHGLLVVLGEYIVVVIFRKYLLRDLLCNTKNLNKGSNHYLVVARNSLSEQVVQGHFSKANYGKKFHFNAVYLCSTSCYNFSCFTKFTLITTTPPVEQETFMSHGYYDCLP